jgi:F-type H+-transporting ATPase subunit a
MLLPALSLVTADESDGGFVGPSISEFVPEGLLFVGTPFELNRVMLIRLLVVAVLVIWLWIGTRNMKLIPTRGQAALEYMLGFVRNTIVFDTLG